MKIAQITPGLISIPPNGWGAVESIIWYYKIYMERAGHTVDICQVTDDLSSYDYVHAHMYNHAIELHQRNIPFIFTLHDHHSYAYGKSSINYKNNLLAMTFAKLAIVPAKYLVSYFDNIPVYISHGVDLTQYSSTPIDTQFSLLCVGNNGFGGDPTFDRKGFKYAIEAATELNIPLTIVGPTDSNKQFFDANSNILSDLITIKYDLTDDELIREYNSHSALIHATAVEAGHPPLTILEAAACGLPILTTDCAGQLYTIPIERSTQYIVSAISDLKDTHALHVYKTIQSVRQYDWEIVVNQLLSMYDIANKSDMLTSITKVYNRLQRIDNDNVVSMNFIDGAFFEMTGPNAAEFNLKFIDTDTNTVVYNTKLGVNQWARCNRKWFTNWKIELEYTDGKSSTYTMNLDTKRVLISLESSSLGDTLAWIPFVEQFRLKHNCHVIVSTFMNDLFVDQYPELEFVKPGVTVDNLYALYRVGLFYDNNSNDFEKHKSDTRKISLQNIAADILGLPFEEIVPKIKKPEKFIAEKPYICIANHSTAQAKYWNNPTGWQDLVDYTLSRGYDVYLISKEADGHMGNKNPVGVTTISGKTLDEIGSILLGSTALVGISSGLSWYAWALGVPTLLISGFTATNLEPQSGIDRIYTSAPCNGCSAIDFFDRGNWNWCPKQAATSRQFECSKLITFENNVKSHLLKYLII